MISRPITFARSHRYGLYVSDLCSLNRSIAVILSNRAVPKPYSDFGLCNVVTVLCSFSLIAFKLYSFLILSCDHHLLVSVFFVTQWSYILRFATASIAPLRLSPPIRPIMSRGAKSRKREF